MRIPRTGAVATLALIGATALAMAQAPEPGKAPPDKSENRGAPGAAKQQPSGKVDRPAQSPTKGDAQRAPETNKPNVKDNVKESGRQAPERAAEPARGSRKAAEPKERTQGRDDAPRNDAQRSDTKPAQKPDKDDRRGKQAEQPDKGKQAQQPDKTEPKAKAKQAEQPGKDEPKGKQAERPDRPAGRGAEQAPDAQRSKRVTTSDDQRRGVRERLFREAKPDKVKVNISLGIGTRVPRSVRLHAFPVTIVEYAPVYRGYSYIVLEDETVYIVDSSSYEVVDVIPAGSQRDGPSQRIHLALSPEQERFVYEGVPKDRSVDLRVRLALGAEIPREVPLERFPGHILDRMPELEPYRFVVVDNREVVIVDPMDYGIALVISR